MTGPWDSVSGEPYPSPVGLPPNSEAPLSKPNNALGVASLVIGIVALLASLTVVGGFVFGVLAAILGLVARAQVRHGQASNGDVAMTGVVLGVLAILASLIIAVFWTVPKMTTLDSETSFTSSASQHQVASR
jgi:hypothetical protein